MCADDLCLKYSKKHGTLLAFFFLPVWPRKVDRRCSFVFCFLQDRKNQQPICYPKIKISATHTHVHTVYIHTRWWTTVYDHAHNYVCMQLKTRLCESFKECQTEFSDFPHSAVADLCPGLYCYCRPSQLSPLGSRDLLVCADCPLHALMIFLYLSLSLTCRYTLHYDFIFSFIFKILLVINKVALKGT